MATHTYEQLKAMTVAQLREIAQGVQDEALGGYSTMHKEQLLPVLCKALNVPTHHTAAAAVKRRVKASLRAMKARRDAALASRDSAQLASALRQIHGLKRRLRRIVTRAV
jgi:hypothetical protein